MHRTISSWQCQFLPRVVAAAKNTTMAALAVTLLRPPPEPPQIFKHWHGDRRGLPRQRLPVKVSRSRDPSPGQNFGPHLPRLRPWDRGRAAAHTCSHSVIAFGSRVSIDELIRGWMSPIVDTHHHFWTYGTYQTSWMETPTYAGDPAFEPLRRSFEPADLAPELQAARVHY